MYVFNPQNTRLKGNKSRKLIHYFKCAMKGKSKYNDFYQWIIDRHFRMDKHLIITKKLGWQSFSDEYIKLGQCFSDAIGVVKGSPHLMYVQGFVWTHLSPVSHAWNYGPVDKKIVDFSYSKAYRNPFKDTIYTGVICLTKEDLDYFHKKYKRFGCSNLMHMVYAEEKGIEYCKREIYEITQEREESRMQY